MAAHSRFSQFLYLAKKNITLASETYTADVLYNKAWTLVHTKPLYSNAKLIAFWRNACILHDTGLEFCQATVRSIKRIVHMYILTGKRGITLIQISL